MSFFGFETRDLEKEKRRFREGRLGEDESDDGTSGDDVAFNLGRGVYDSIGNTLLEGGDDLNDETFGTAGPVGRDFDYTAQTLPSDEFPASRSRLLQDRSDDLRGSRTSSPSRPLQPNRPQVDPHKSLWDNKSPFSVLPRAGSSATTRLDHFTSSTPSTLASKPSLTFDPSANAGKQLPATGRPVSTATPVQYAATGVRTLQEVEAEMRAQTQQARALNARAEYMKPAATRAESPSYVQAQASSRHLADLAYQRQLLERQEQLRIHEQQEQLRMQEQQEQLRMQDLERQFRQQALLEEIREREFREQELREHEIRQQEQRRLQALHERQQVLFQQQQQEQRLLAQAQAVREQQLQARLPQQQQQRSQRSSPANGPSLAQIQSLQRQQQMLAQLAQVEFSQNFSNVNGNNGAIPEQHDALREEAMKKIMEHERMEGKRRRKASKIAFMSRYNDLMTQSDKDFITRIQVSQLVTSDPYAEDYYAQVYVSALLGLESDERVLKFGSGEGVGLGLGNRGAGRRPNALQRMEAQVERIVNNARQREKEKGLHALHSLQGALGKTAGRSYKAAPRQLLQVDTAKEITSPKPAHAHASTSPDNADHHDASNAQGLGHVGAGVESSTVSNGTLGQEPLARREALVILEELYDKLLQLDQLRREAQSSSPHDQDRLLDTYSNIQQELFDGLRIMLPIETSNPHPLVSLLAPAKGKRMLPRALRALPHDQALSVLVLLFACFSQLDVVVQATLLDSDKPSTERREVEVQTDIFLHDVLPGIAEVLVNSRLQICVGLLTLLLNHCDVVRIAMTWPGLELLRIVLHRAKVDSSEVLTEEEQAAWRRVWNRLFDSLIAYLPMLFPSARVHPSEAQNGTVDQSLDAQEEPVWRFFATLVLHAEGDQPQYLVQVLREKILENYVAATEGYNLDDAQRKKKIANIDLFLHRLGLDSSQISL